MFCDDDDETCFGPVDQVDGVCPLGHDVVRYTCDQHRQVERICWPCWRDASILVLVEVRTYS